jgi:murein DD-endopeptidase MepM/ murein hydrolase activator NlpD
MRDGARTWGRGIGGALAMLAAWSVTAALPIPAASADDAASVIKIAPPSPVQGDTLMITVSAPGARHVSVQYDGGAVTAYRLPDGTRRALIGTDPTVATGSHTVAVTFTETGRAPWLVSRAVRLNVGHFEVRTLTLPPKTFGLITPQNAAIERRALRPVLSRRTPEPLWSGPFLAPSSGTMDSPYGYQSVYNGRRMWWHQGMDFAAPEGAPVVAANAGVVVLAQGLPLGGNTVIIDHGQGVLTEYLHLSAFAAHVGAHVERGALIARIGTTGLVTGPSLHWGLYVNGTWVNPLFWMHAHPGLTQ